MIDHDEYHSAMLRMSQFKIGVKEAVALFCIGDGATIQSIAARCRDSKQNIQTRLGMLKMKGYLHTDDRTTGKITYRLTPIGLEIVNSTLAKNETRNTHIS
jgi:hypothetical protein